LQLTARGFGFNNVFGVATGFGLSDGFRQIPAATELFRQAEQCKGRIYYAYDSFTRAL